MTPRGYTVALVISVLGLTAPWLAPAYTFQIAVMYLMIVFALTWDIMGGQMGYNSLGNIFFFGAGMYATAIVQVGLFYNLYEYTSPSGGVQIDFSTTQYFFGYFLGLAFAALICLGLAFVIGPIVFGLRGPYFAIGTLGIAIAGGELVGTWEMVGAGGGMSMPVYPGGPEERAYFFYIQYFILTVVVFFVLRWIYSTRFGLAINAIRDDEEKAEAMGVHTARYKAIAWAISAGFLGIAGGIFGNMTGFIEPLEVAFPTVTFGIFMVLMALLGGKGTLWGPVLGAVVFHIIKEVTWTYLLGWQWVALGLLIVVNVVYFQQGILGWAMEKFPERFGLVVDRTNQSNESG